MQKQSNINNLLQYIHLLFGLLIILWMNNGLLTLITVYLSDYIIVIIFLIWFAVACVAKREYLSQYFAKTVFLFFFFNILLVIHYTNELVDVTYNLKTTILFMVIFAILLYYYNDHLKYQKIILFILILDNIFIGINTYIKLQQIPNLSRYLSGGGLVEIFGTTNYLVVGNYTYAYSMVMVSFMCVYNIFYKNKNKIINVLGYILICLIIVKMEFTIALLSIITGTFCLIFVKIKKNIILLLILFFSFFFFIFNNAILKLIYNYISESIVIKIYEVVSLFSGKTIQNSALNLRLTLYIQSIDVFLNNILIGALNNNFVIGGHSTWLDFLGQIGLLSCPIYVFFVMCYLYIKKTVPKNTLVYVKACFIYIFFLGFINTVYIARILLTLVVFVPFAAKVLCENENI